MTTLLMLAQLAWAASTDSVIDLEAFKEQQMRIMRENASRSVIWAENTRPELGCTWCPKPEPIRQLKQLSEDEFRAASPAHIKGRPLCFFTSKEIAKEYECKCWTDGESSWCEPVKKPEPKVLWWADDVRIFTVKKYENEWGILMASQTAVLSLMDDGTVRWRLVPWGVREKAKALAEQEDKR